MLAPGGVARKTVPAAKKSWPPPGATRTTCRPIAVTIGVVDDVADRVGIAEHTTALPRGGVIACAARNTTPSIRTLPAKPAPPSHLGARTRRPPPRDPCDLNPANVAGYSTSSLPPPARSAPPCRCPD